MQKNFWFNTCEEKFQLPVRGKGEDKILYPSFANLWAIDLGDQYQKVDHFFKSFKVDHFNKLIVMEIYEVINSDTWNWLWWVMETKDNPNHYLRHIRYSGHEDNKIIAITEYSGLKIVGHSIGYDYSHDGVAVNVITLEYEKAEKLATPSDLT
jgi:hypothetical protein